MPRVTHFEIHADDPQRAVNFYSEVFGWNINKWDGPDDYWLVGTEEGEEPGINGGILKRPKPDMATINTINVKNIDEFATGIMEAGGRIARPKEIVPGVGYLAYCYDTEGNMFGIMQYDNDPK